MIYYNTNGKTFNQIAADQTIGGSVYGLALARHNAFEDANAQAPAQIDIPTDWLGNATTAVLVGRPPETVTQGTANPSQDKMLLYGGIALVALAALLAVTR